MTYEMSEWIEKIWKPATEREKQKVREEMRKEINKAYKDGYNTALDKTKRKYVCKICKETKLIEKLRGEGK